MRSAGIGKSSSMRSPGFHARRISVYVAGAVTDADLEHLARLAPHAVLVAPGTVEAVVTPIRERLLAKGFSDMALFTGIPPRPDVTAGASTEAA